jgi:hypothetical protein
LRRVGAVSEFLTASRTHDIPSDDNPRDAAPAENAVDNSARSHASLAFGPANFCHANLVAAIRALAASELMYLPALAQDNDGQQEGKQDSNRNKQCDEEKAMRDSPQSLFAASYRSLHLPIARG